MSPEEALARIQGEYERAAARFAPFNTPHEGYAVILEELDELWDEVKSKDGLGRACEEAVQVAAMALRFLVDLPKAGRIQAELSGEAIAEGPTSLRAAP
jgi:hypothetical protein